MGDPGRTAYEARDADARHRWDAWGCACVYCGAYKGSLTGIQPCRALADHTADSRISDEAEARRAAPAVLRDLSPEEKAARAAALAEARRREGWRP